MRLRIGADLDCKVTDHAKAQSAGSAILNDLIRAVDDVLVKHGYEVNRVNDEGRVPSTSHVELEWGRG